LIVLAQRLTIFWVVARLLRSWPIRITFVSLVFRRRHLHRAGRVRLGGGATLHSTVTRGSKFRGQISTALELSQELSWLRKLLVKLRGGHVECREVFYLRLGQGIVDLFRRQL